MEIDSMYIHRNCLSALKKRKGGRDESSQGE